MKKDVRDSRFESLRIIAMFLIVCCHFTANIHWNLEVDNPFVPAYVAVAVDQYFGQMGVCIFFFLSGYFLVSKDKLGKHVIKTWLQTLIYSVILFFFSCLLWSLNGEMSAKVFLKGLYISFFPILNSNYWFVTVYVFVLLCAPFVNYIINKFDKKSCMKIVILFLISSLLPLFSRTTFIWTPLVYGLVVYCCGALTRLYGASVPFKINVYFVIIFCAISLLTLSCFFFVLNDIGILNSFMNSKRHVFGTIPLLPICSIILVFLYIVQNTKKKESRFILKISPSVFGVYLIHENHLFKPFFWDFISTVFPMPKSLLSLIVTGLLEIFLIYAVCLMASWLIDTIFVRNLEKKIMRIPF